MKMLSAAISLTRFRILDAVPQTLWTEIPDKLKQFAFQDIDDISVVSSHGWVSIDHMLDTKWQLSPPEKGEYIAFSFRIDTRRISAAVFKKYLLMAMEKEQELMKKQGKIFISRERKSEIREQVKLSIMTKTLPTPAVIDVIWATGTNIIYLATTQSSVLDLFANYFTQTFDLHLEQLMPTNLGIEKFKQAGLPYPNELDEIGDIELGQDFLTWAWFRSETNTMGFEDGKNPFLINIEKKIVVQGGEGESFETATVAGALSELAEAKLGLKNGKKVSKACIRLEQSELYWQCTLNAMSFAFTGLKTPRTDKDDDEPDALFMDKMYFIERFCTLFDIAYMEFLKIRLDHESWNVECKNMNEWLKAKQD